MKFFKIGDIVKANTTSSFHTPIKLGRYYKIASLSEAHPGVMFIVFDCGNPVSVYMKDFTLVRSKKVNYLIY